MPKAWTTRAGCRDDARSVQAVVARGRLRRPCRVHPPFRGRRLPGSSTRRSTERRAELRRQVGTAERLNDATLACSLLRRTVRRSSRHRCRLDLDELRQQVLGNPRRRQQVLNMRSTLVATDAVPVAGGCQQMLSYSVNALLMTVRSTPLRPSGAWIRGFERVGQAVLNRGYERTSGVLAGEVLTLALKEIPMQAATSFAAENVWWEGAFGRRGCSVAVCVRDLTRGVDDVRHR
jgi:hypothetical protein